MDSTMEPIAIIGLACRFPGADNATRLWQNLVAGREAITALTDEQLRAAGVPEPLIADPDYVKMAGLMPDYDRFDAEFFGLTPREARLCDPQLRAFLEVSHAAVEDAGYDPYRMSDVVGVFGSSGGNDYVHQFISSSPGGSSSLVASMNNVDYVAALASYKLNFTGPSLTVVTACSSSLVAVHLACQSLRLGESDVALAGGVNVELSALHGYSWAPGGVRSRDGHCRPFDASGGGTLFTSGAGVVVLKRLADALTDGDHIRAVILGVAINNDGADKVSFGAPSAGGQIACITEAMTAAQVDPADVGYVEAHGTGTAMGDPVELMALTQAWRMLSGRPLPAGVCGLGSIKSNLGHLVQAAGVASLIKLTLSLERCQMAPSININQLNPRLELESSPFFVNDTLRPWPRQAGRRRIGAASAMAVGGTNAHIVVEEAPARPDPRPSGRPRVVVWSARTAEAAQTYGERLAEHFAQPGHDDFDAAADTLARGRTPFPVRRAVVADSPAAAVAALGAEPLAAGMVPESGAPPVLFAFPGQGSLQPRMGQGRYGSDSAFSAAIDACWEAFGVRGAELRDRWLHEEDGLALADTRIAQPLLFAVEYSLAQSWRALGIEPTALIGHSVGELVAATVAGLVGLEAAASLVLARAEAMHRMPAGAMAAVLAPLEEIDVPDGIAVAAVNAPAETVLSGPADALDQYLGRLRAEGKRTMKLRTSHAFHSPAMAGAVTEFAAAFDGVELSPPAIPVISCATGLPMTAEQAVDPQFWASQLIEPVFFARAAAFAFAQRPFDVIEVGPGTALTGLMRKLPEFGERLVVPALPRVREAADEYAGRLGALATLWVRGHPVDWAALEPDRPPRRASVPGYPYQRERYWPDRAPATMPGTAAAEPATATSAPTPVPASPFYVASWHEEPVPEPERQHADEPALVLLPEDPADGLPVVTALCQAGYRVIPVRPGQTYRDAEGDARIRLVSSEDAGALLASLASRGIGVTTVVHALGTVPWPAPASDNLAEQLDRSVHSLLALVQQSARAATGGKLPRILVLARHAVDVSGTEPLDPVKAAMTGLVRTLAQEEPGLRPLLVDLGPGPDEYAFVAQLRAPATTPVVALRGARRWVEHESPYPTPAAAGTSEPPAIRQDGGYLITGGMGGLGLELAKGLARTGLRPRLVLVGRTVPADDGDDQRAIAVRAAVAELAALGAQVRCVTGDVADPRQARRVVDIAAAHLGRIDGVFHLAGVPGDGMLLLRDRARVEAVLRPKVHGAVVLAEALHGRPAPDFVVYFSSLAGARGFVGGGDYAAANAVLDALAAASAGRNRVLSVAWPAWSGVGMAVPALAAADDLGEIAWQTTLSPRNTWSLDEHRVGGVPVLPATGHLDLVARALLAHVGTEPGVGVQVTEAVFQAPLAATEPHQVRVVLRPEDDRWEFRLESAPSAGAARWRRHSSGYVAAIPAAVRTVDLAGLRARFADVAPEASRAQGPRMFSLGPRWDCAVAVRRLDSEVLAEIRLPEAFTGDLDTHVLHPAVLDAATGALRDAQRDGACIPFLYRSMRVHAPLPGTITSHLRRRPGPARTITGDLDLIGPDGRVLAEIEGFTMRAIDPRRFSDELSDDGQAGEAPAGQEAAGLPPETGVRLMMDLLRTRGPAHVLVPPYRDGRPAPNASPLRPAPAPRAGAAASAPAVVAPASRTAVAPPPPAGSPGGGEVLHGLRELWSAALGVADIGPDDDFFALGGNSLTAVELMTAIHQRFGAELSIATLLDSPTLGAVAQALDRTVPAR